MRERLVSVATTMPVSRLTLRAEQGRLVAALGHLQPAAAPAGVAAARRQLVAAGRKPAAEVAADPGAPVRPTALRACRAKGTAATVFRGPLARLGRCNAGVAAPCLCGLAAWVAAPRAEAEARGARGRGAGLADAGGLRGPRDGECRSCSLSLVLVPCCCSRLVRMFFARNWNARNDELKQGTKNKEQGTENAALRCSLERSEACEIVDG